MRIVISGYYGFGNVGDEAVLSAMLATLRDRFPSAQVIVLSANPDQTRSMHNVRSIRRSGPAAIRALVGADLFVSGGGSLIQDVTSWGSSLYYLGLLALAALLSRRTMIFAQGFGPLRRRWLRRLARVVLNRVDVIAVRDEDSVRAIEGLGVRRPAHLVADPVFALDPTSDGHLHGRTGWGEKGPRIGVALRPWGDSAYIPAVIEAVRAVRNTLGGTVVVFAFHPDRDLPLSQTAADALGAEVIAGLPPRETLSAIGTLDVLVGVRLHALICAVVMGVPPIGLSYDPKVDGLFRRIGVGHMLPVDGLQSGTLEQAVLSVWHARDQIRPRLFELAKTLREEALRAADLAKALVSAGRR